MNKIDIAGMIPLLWLTLCINPTLAWLSAWRAEWFAYKRSGRFNFDDRMDTYDWANKRDPATGKKELICITAYNPPKNGPGSGSVVFYTRNDDGGDERNQWRLMAWEKQIENLSEVSVSQARAIKDADGCWPPLSPGRPTDLCMVDALDSLCNDLKGFGEKLDSVSNKFFEGCKMVVKDWDG